MCLCMEQSPLKRWDAHAQHMRHPPANTHKLRADCHKGFHEGYTEHHFRHTACLPRALGPGAHREVRLHQRKVGLAVIAHGSRVRRRQQRCARCQPHAVLSGPRWANNTLISLKQSTIGCTVAPALAFAAQGVVQGAPCHTAQRHTCPSKCAPHE